MCVARICRSARSKSLGVNKWEDELKANRVTWRGQQYDSQLEADWAATFTQWGMLYVYHPGRLFLSDGVVWEPDFQLDGDVVFEVKGAHNNRIEKVVAAGDETDLQIIVGRTGWMPSGSDLEHAGAVWEPDEWVVANYNGRVVFERASNMHPEGMYYPTYLYYSAPYASEYELMGIEMYKAVGEDSIV